MSVNFLNHRGKRVLYIDYSECRCPNEMIATANSAADAVGHLPGRILILSNFNGAYASSEFLAHAKKLRDEVFQQKSEKSAAFGIDARQRLFLNDYNSDTTCTSGYGVIPFPSKEAALNYLTEDENNLNISLPKKAGKTSFNLVH